jgi:hypothetical protein
VGLFRVSVIGDADLELVDDPVAAHAFQRPKLTGGLRVVGSGECQEKTYGHTGEVRTT